MSKGLPNKLKGHCTYLCGSIDMAGDCGIGWRREITPFLHQMGIGVFNPCEKADLDGLHENFEYRDKIADLKRVGKLSEKGETGATPEVYANEIHRLMKPVAATDLRQVDLSSFIITYLDLDIFMCGSMSEMSYAIQQRKPVLICCKQGKFEIPNWLYSIANHNEFFSCWSDLKTYLVGINDGSIAASSRWKFYNFEKIFGKD